MNDYIEQFLTKPKMVEIATIRLVCAKLRAVCMSVEELGLTHSAYVLQHEYQWMGCNDINWIQCCHKVLLLSAISNVNSMYI